MEKVVELAISAASFLEGENVKIVDEKICVNAHSYLQALSLDDPALLIYRAAVEEQQNKVGVVRVMNLNTNVNKGVNIISAMIGLYCSSALDLLGHGFST